MDFFSHLLAILGAVALLLLYNLWRAKHSRHKSKGRSFAPEAAGGWPIIGHLHLLSGPKTLAQTMSAMAEKHGPIFTLWLGVHRTVVISSYEAMKECFTTSDKVFASRPPSSQAKYVGYNNANFGFAPYGAYWRDMRKLAMVELLSSNRIKALRQIHVSEADHLVKALFSVSRSNGNGPVKVVLDELLEHLTLNIITRMIAGKRFFDHSIEGGNGGEGHEIGELIKRFLNIMGVAVPSDLIPFTGWMDIGGTVKSMKRLAEEVDSVMENWIEEHELKRRNGGANNKSEDFIDVLLSKIEDNSAFSHDRKTIIKATTSSFILAGADTMSIALTWAFCNLLNNTRALKLAQEELDLKVGKDRCVEDSDIDNLPYIQAIIKETLRLCPPGPLAVPRQATEDCYLCGYYIPKGTHLFINLWKLHRDPNTWTDPDAFVPERFLTSHANLTVNGQNFEFLPFSGGRRACPGTNLAMQVMQLTLARLVHAFDFTKPSDEPVDTTLALSLALIKKTPLEVVVTPRLASQLY
uniref:Uncharacterized protein MANES_12G048600 n=1 Tax=Rhizophora mucronata TaxID=61149 RepID=A0A2P2NZH0_RHIMU